VSAAVATRTFQALGTTAQVSVTDAGALESAVAAVEDELAAIDLACSRFRDDSELTALNRSAGRPFSASPLLIEALQVALRAADLTDGDVDPTIGRAMTGLGWDCDFSVLVSRGERGRFRVVPAAGWRSISVDAGRGVVAVPAGVEIDLGATAKALAADRSARSAFVAAGDVGVLVSLGGDLAVAGPPPGDGWDVLVTDDHRSPADADGQTVAIKSGGLATSSTTVRRWRAGGREHHHIVDPRTGLAAEEVWRTVSAAAATCVDANIATTAAIVRGREAPSWLEQTGLPARLVAVDGSVSYVGDWPEATP
jgi:thiamine biosynthesis lipoprotein